MTREQIYREALEEIGSLDADFSCNRCQYPAINCAQHGKCSGAIARAALEAAAKAPVPLADPDLRLAVFNAVYEHCDADQIAATCCTIDVLRALHGYQRGDK